MKNQVQLITYADRLGGGTLDSLRTLLGGALRGVFGGVHVLPFFLPIDGADAGFDPSDHTKVDSRLGGWEDVRALTREVAVVADVIVNHISADSPQFQDYLQHGAQSAHAGLFLSVDDVFPGGARDADLAKIYRPRPGRPFTKVHLKSGEEVQLWTTFTSQQVDINVEAPQGRAYLEGILDRFKQADIRMIRLDAVGYAIKRAGTSCFMLPETFQFIGDLTNRVRELGMEVLVEVHSYYQDQIEIARHVDWVYDFALPPLILHAFGTGSARNLAEWIRIRPRNAVTVLDTHDGIGIVDVGPDPSDPERRPGLVPLEELDKLVEMIHHRTGGASKMATGAAASNVDLYQVNTTIFDAMGRDEEAYLLARAIQFMLPGIPQVYYVGLLAGENDLALLTRTGVGRDINRHYYSEAEVYQKLERRVVCRLLDLIALRNRHEAFAGDFEARFPSGTELVMTWISGFHWVSLSVNFATVAGELRYTEGKEVVRRYFGTELEGGEQGSDSAASLWPLGPVD